MATPNDRRTVARLSMVAGSAATLAAAWLGIIKVEGNPPLDAADAAATNGRTLAAQSSVPGTATVPPVASTTGTPGTSTPSGTATKPATTPAATTPTLPAPTSTSAGATTVRPATTPALPTVAPTATSTLIPAPTATVAPAVPTTPVPVATPRPTRRSRAS